MTKIKFCGLRTVDDINAVNQLLPEYVGFVFAPKSKRRVTVDVAEKLRGLLSTKIQAVGVFVNENFQTVGELLNAGIIDAAQLHGDESEDYIRRLRTVTDKPIIKAFRVDTLADTSADFVLIDAGAGDGRTFDWRRVTNFGREFFLAGGLTVDNVGAAIELLHPFAVDVSSGIETDGRKDFGKMTAFANVVRNVAKKGRHG